MLCPTFYMDDSREEEVERVAIVKRASLCLSFPFNFREIVIVCFENFFPCLASLREELNRHTALSQQTPQTCCRYMRTIEPEDIIMYTRELRDV
jgi:hypothetical protein